MDYRYIRSSQGQSYRVSPAIHTIRKLLMEIPELSDRDLVELLKGKFTESQIADIHQDLSRNDLLQEPKIVRPKRIEFHKPFSIQLNVLTSKMPPNAERACGSFWRIFQSSLLTYCYLAWAVTGVAVLASQRESVGLYLVNPLNLRAALGVYILVMISYFVHEFSHYATSKAYGLTPERAGVMVFYTGFAFFCDVTNSWQLSRKSRLKILRAGILSDAMLGGLLATSGIFFSGNARTALLLSSLASYLLVLSNSIPFLKLDGYLILSTRIDVPFLREYALKDFKKLIFRRVFGILELEYRNAWSPYFGLASAVTVELLLLQVPIFAITDLSFRGVFGAELCAIILILYFIFLLVRFSKILQVAWTLKTNIIRYFLGIAVILLTISLIPFLGVYTSQRMGVIQINGTYLAVDSTTQPLSKLYSRSVVDLHNSGIFSGHIIGTGNLRGDARACDVPFKTISPYFNINELVPALCYPMEVKLNSKNQPGNMSITLRQKREMIYHLIFSKLKALIK